MEEDSADSLDVDFETRDMSVIVQIKSAVNDTETEITDMEFNNEYIDENRLVDLEQNLEKEESFLDGLGQRSRRARRGAHRSRSPSPTTRRRVDPDYSHA